MTSLGTFGQHNFPARPQKISHHGRTLVTQWKKNAQNHARESCEWMRRDSADSGGLVYLGLEGRVTRVPIARAIPRGRGTLGGFYP